MKVSVIVPVYNKEKYLNQCIESLVRQTYKNIEIILVDDESSDSSGEICDEWKKKDNRIIVLHQKNTGAAGAWRKGFSVATGRYISFVDADDWIDEDMISKLVAVACDRADEIILSDYLIEKEGLAPVPVFQALEPGVYEGETVRDAVIPRLWGYEDRYICMSRCMKLFSRELIQNNEHYSRSGLRFGEDNALTLPCVLDSGRIVVLDHEAMYHYRFVDESVVHKYDATLLPSIELLQNITESMIVDKFEGNDRNRFLELCKKEFPILLMFAVKNEIRGDVKYRSRIKALCGKEGYSSWIKDYPLAINHLSNKIIYAVMKHPNAFMCWGLRVAMKCWANR